MAKKRSPGTEGTVHGAACVSIEQRAPSIVPVLTKEAWLRVSLSDGRVLSFPLQYRHAFETEGDRRPLYDAGFFARKNTGLKRRHWRHHNVRLATPHELPDFVDQDAIHEGRCFIATQLRPAGRLHHIRFMGRLTPYEYDKHLPYQLTSLNEMDCRAIYEALAGACT